MCLSGRWLALGVAGWGLPFVVLAGVSNEAPALVLLAVVGVANAIVDVAYFTRQLGTADCFGEIAGLTGSRRTATVRADTELVLLQLTSKQFVLAVSGYTLSNTQAYALVEERLARGVSSTAGRWRRPNRKFGA